MGSPPMSLTSLFVVAGAAVLSLHSTATATSVAISATLLSQQQTVNAQIELYYVQQGRLPWPPGEVAGTQWRPLVEEGYLHAAPRNELSPPPVATRIVELTKVGDRGLDIDLAEAGWVWNSTDCVLYPVGLDAWLARQETARRSFTPVLFLVGASAGILVLFFGTWALGRCVKAAWPASLRLDRMSPPRRRVFDKLWGGVVGATLGGVVAFIGIIVTHLLGFDFLAFVLLPVFVVPGFFLGYEFGDIGTGAHHTTEPSRGAGTALSPWAEVAFWIGVSAVLVVTAPLSIVVAVIAIRDVIRGPYTRGLDRAVFALLMGAVASLVLVNEIAELWPPN